MKIMLAGAPFDNGLLVPFSCGDFDSLVPMELGQTPYTTL